LTIRAGGMRGQFTSIRRMKARTALRTAAKCARNSESQGPIRARLGSDPDVGVNGWLDRLQPVWQEAGQQPARASTAYTRSGQQPNRDRPSAGLERHLGWTGAR